MKEKNLFSERGRKQERKRNREKEKGNEFY